MAEGNRIFSLTNESTHKVLRLFGTKISVNLKYFFNLKYGKLPLDDKKIVFCNFKGNGYGCNPKYVAEEILKRKLPYKLVWLIKNNISEEIKNTVPENIKLVNYSSSKALKELATAKVWIDNQRKNYFIKKGLRKKENQKYIQLWHGSLGIKKIGLDSPLSEVEKEWIPYGIEDSKMINYAISDSVFEDDIFSRNFFGNVEISRLGHPRNDIFYYSDEELQKIKDKVYETYEIEKDKKIFLYVPSYRDNYDISSYNLEYKTLRNVLKERFGGDWVIVARFHPRVKKIAKNLLPQKDFIVNATEYPDIQELLVASEIALTDYSSCIFDFMLSRKPAFIFASDIEDFDQDRGFYYPLTSTPFPVAETNEQLRQNILKFDYETYKCKVEEFLKEKGCMEDGHASERVVDLIESIMEGKV